MKKVLMIVALSLAVAVPSMAQMKTVKQVERVAKSDKPDLKQGRELIGQAMVNPESANEAQTWYVAGLLEQTVVDSNKTKAMLNQEFDEPGMYDALGRMIPYYLKADSLERQPNDKGKVRRKYQKDIEKAVAENAGFLVNAGSYYLNNNEFEKAHKFFKQYMDVKKAPMFEGTEMAAQDSMSMQIGFFSAYAASQIADNTQNAIAEYEAIKSVPYRQNDVYQLLAASYQQVGDTVKFMDTLKEGAEIFPEDKYFLFNMINIYIRQGENEKARDYLTQAIAKDPQNKQLYHVLATVYEQGFKDVAKAEENFKKALEIDPEYADGVIGLGRVYYNQAVALQSDANAVTDGAKYKELDNQAKELFKKALPYFEKAVQLEPENTEYLMALRGIYYNLKMDDKMAEIEKKLGTNQ